MDQRSLTSSHIPFPSHPLLIPFSFLHLLSSALPSILSHSFYTLTLVLSSCRVSSAWALKGLWCAFACLTKLKLNVTQPFLGSISNHCALHRLQGPKGKPEGIQHCDSWCRFVILSLDLTLRLGWALCVGGAGVGMDQAWTRILVDWWAD